MGFRDSRFCTLSVNEMWVLKHGARGRGGNIIYNRNERTVNIFLGVAF